LEDLGVDEGLTLRWNLRKVDEAWIQVTPIKLQTWALENIAIHLKVQ
jgi:hypothetical protein